MRHASNKKRQMTSDGGNGITKSRTKLERSVKGNYKYKGILKADTIKQEEMKEKIKKEYFRRTKKLLETKLYSRNLIKGINTWIVLLERYSEPFLKWTIEQHRQTTCVKKRRKRSYLH